MGVAIVEISTMRANFRAAVLEMSRPFVVVTLMAFVVLWGVACQRTSDLESPEQTVIAFIDRMRRIHGDPERSLEAYALMANSTQANLIERANRASAAAGRLVGPEEMLGPSRFFLEFPAVRYSTRLGRDWAIVTVEGERPEMRREVRCRKEGGLWKIEIDLPELPPLERSAR